jgi:hypothetical protein
MDSVNELYTIVCNLKEKGIILNRSGIFDTKIPIRFRDNIERLPFTELEIKNSSDYILQAVKIAPLCVKTTTRKYLVGSYGLKHVVEKHLTSGYISNGEMILVMLYLKYDMKLPKESPINCNFACKYIESDGSTGV